MHIYIVVRDMYMYQRPLPKDRPESSQASLTGSYGPVKARQLAQWHCLSYEVFGTIHYNNIFPRQCIPYYANYAEKFCSHLGLKPDW